MEGAESITKIESENFKFQNDEYLLEMTLYSDDFIEFKITQNSPTAACCYSEKFNFKKITDISYLNPNKLDMKKVYKIYKMLINDNKIDLILSQDKNIMTIHYKTSVNYEDTDVNIELKKKTLKDEDIINKLMKVVDELKKENEKMKKDIDFLMGEFNKRIEKEKEAEKKEKQLQKEEEELSSKNDNVNLINDFKSDNIEQIQNQIKNIDLIICPFPNNSPSNRFKANLVTVYCMIKNNERLYQIAYAIEGVLFIYDFVKKNENTIYLGFEIKKLQHYYNPSNKMHMLLFTSDNIIQLWNISSYPIMNIIKIENINIPSEACCLMFKNDEFNIFGFNRYNDNNVLECWSKNGTRKNSINTSQFFDYCTFMEATYIESKSYILMGVYNSKTNSYYAQCYDDNENKFHPYKNNNKKSTSQITCINLFNKGNKIEDIDLIVYGNDKIEVFNFINKNLIREITINNISSLCTINQKYVFVSDSKSNKIKIIDKEYSLLNKEYNTMHAEIHGIKKIKIPEIGECIITISDPVIGLWKI